MNLLSKLPKFLDSSHLCLEKKKLLCSRLSHVPHLTDQVVEVMKKKIKLICHWRKWLVLPRKLKTTLKNWENSVGQCFLTHFLSLVSFFTLWKHRKRLILWCQKQSFADVLLKKRLQHRCFLVNIAKSARTVFYRTPQVAASVMFLGSVKRDQLA